MIEARGLKKHYPIKRFLKEPLTVKALDGVSFKLERGKTLAVVGESGCGKSTLAKVLMQMEAPTAGQVLVEGRDVASLPKQERVRLVQMVFQDPYGSINPRKKAWQIISEPLVINESMSAQERKQRALEVMKQVGLRPELVDRYPHMFSGGQRQRIGIARALMLQPQVMICDEPVSALDLSIQAQVLNLLMDLQDKFKLSYLFISHDLAVVRHIADDVMVMYLGKVVEFGSHKAVFSSPKHPYTQALLESSVVTLQGELPSPLNPPSGCALHKRCPHAMPRCSVETPALREVDGRQVACHLEFNK
jgi:dipeptide transport system ATP-binding protein